VDSVHDMGGMHGFGPVLHEENEPVFHEDWEGHVYAFGTAVKGPLFRNTDAGRYALEVLPPAEYLASTYYGRWLMRTERRIVELGYVTQQELDERLAYYREHSDAPVPRGSDAATMERAQSRYERRPRSLHRTDGTPPRFKAGDTVRTINNHPLTHTRLPRYARDKCGVIVRVNGIHDLADNIAHGLPPEPQANYSVRFDARELWGDDAEGEGCVYLDLWDCYLEPADRRNDAAD